MQQKTNIRLLISLCVLIIITALLIFLFNRTDNVVDKTVFRIADLRSVDKVVLEHDSSKVELKLDASGRWKVNDQLADRSMIDVLFATLQQAEPKRRPATQILVPATDGKDLPSDRKKEGKKARKKPGFWKWWRKKQ